MLFAEAIAARVAAAPHRQHGLLHAALCRRATTSSRCWCARTRRNHWTPRMKAPPRAASPRCCSQPLPRTRSCRARSARAFLDAGVPLAQRRDGGAGVGSRAPLFVHDPTRPMNPASVMKLVTTFAALELLGRDYRWKTEAYLGGPLDDGALHGDLILKGYGDPKITIEQWQAFMAALRAAGARPDRRATWCSTAAGFRLPAHDPGAIRPGAAEALQRRTRRAARQLQVGAVRVRARTPRGNAVDRARGAGAARRRPRRPPLLAPAAIAATGAATLGAHVRERRRHRRRPRFAGRYRAVVRRARLVRRAARPSALRPRHVHRPISAKRAASSTAG